MNELSTGAEAPGTDNVRRIREAVAALNRADVDTYAAAFGAECRRWSSGLVGGIPASVVADTLRDLIGAFSGFRLDEELLVGTGPYVIARWLLSGTHTGDFAGIAATGRPVTVRTCEIYELAHGQVVATWAYGDPLELFNQLSPGKEAG